MTITQTKRHHYDQLRTLGGLFYGHPQGDGKSHILYCDKTLCGTDVRSWFYKDAVLPWDISYRFLGCSKCRTALTR